MCRGIIIEMTDQEIPPDTLTILVVDDDARVCSTFARNLRVAGYRVLTASGGEEGLATYARERPDISVVDLRMPGVDGLSVLRTIREDNPEAEVIITTGHGDKEEVVAALRGGASDFIAKPIDQVTLETALRRSQERLRLKRELEQHRHHLEELVAVRTAELRQELSARQRAEEALRFDEARFEALYELSQVSQASEKEIVDFALEAGVRLTRSQIGYLHFFHSDQVNLELFTWSEKALQMCDAPLTGRYPLEEAGIWADCVRQEQSVIHNQYQDLPDKRGYPEGHVHVDRHMSVPIFEEDRVVAVVGVGNKVEPYDEADVRQLRLFASQMWDILQRKRAEERLRNSEERFRAIFEHANDGIVLIDREGLVLEWNPGWENVSGLARDQVVGRPIWEILYQLTPHDRRTDETRERLKTSSLALIQHDHALHLEGVLEYCCQRPDGAVRILQAVVHPIRGDESLSAVGIARDITERRRAEESLRERDRLLRLLVENADDIFVLQDLEGRYLYHHGAPRYGLVSADVVGRTPFDFFDPDTAADIIAHVDQVFSQGEPIVDEQQIVWQEEPLWFVNHRYPVRDDEGRIVAVGTIARNITERKRMEEAIRRSEDRFRMIFESANDMLWILSLDGEILQVNETTCNILGYTKEEMIGWRVSDVVTSQGAAQVPTRLARIKEQGEAVFELEHVRKDGGRIPVEINVRIVDFGQGPVLLSVIRDIRERKRAQEALAEQQRLTESIVATLPDILYLYDTQQEAHTYISREMASLLGYSSEEIKSLGADFILERIYPRDLPRVTEHLERMAGATGDNIYSLEYRIRNKAEQYVWFHIRERVYQWDADGRPAIIFGVIQDVTQRKRVEEERTRLLVAERGQRLQAETLAEVTLALTTQIDLEAVMDEVLCQTRRLVPFETANIALLKKGMLQIVYAQGYAARGCDSFIHGLVQHPDDYPIDAEAIRLKSPVVVSDTRQDSRWMMVEETAWIRSYLVVPICLGDRVTGLLRLDGENPGMFTLADGVRLKSLANAAAIALENARLYHELQEQEEQYRTLVENQGEGMVIIDPEETFIFANPVAHEIFDLPAGTLVGRNLNEFVTSETFAQIQAQTELRRQGKSSSYEVDIQRADGETRRVLVTATPRFDDQEEFIGNFGIFRDITEKKRVEDALRRRTEQLEDLRQALEQRVEERTAALQAQYARLDAILNSITDGIVVTDAAGEIIQLNAVAEQWLNQTLSLEEARRLREAVSGAVTQMDRDERTKLLELEGLDLELRTAPISESTLAPGEVGRLNRRAEGDPAAVVDIHDVTYLKALDRIKMRFIESVSHEFRTPATTIKLYAHLMEQYPDKWQEYLPHLIGEADHQARLVEDVMIISRIDAGRIELTPRPTCLSSLVEPVVDGLRTLAQEREVTLEMCRPDMGLSTDESVIALVDPGRLAQALRYVIENGILYTSAGGRVMVTVGTSLAQGRHWATVTVADTGMGIPPEEIAHVFDSFFRGEALRSMQTSGTGLGLSIVQKISELHGGRVTVESELGVGSTFVIWLPLVNQAGG